MKKRGAILPVSDLVTMIGNLKDLSLVAGICGTHPWEMQCTLCINMWTRVFVGFISQLDPYPMQNIYSFSPWSHLCDIKKLHLYYISWLISKIFNLRHHKFENWNKEFFIPQACHNIRVVPGMKSQECIPHWFQQPVIQIKFQKKTLFLWIVIIFIYLSQTSNKLF